MSASVKNGGAAFPCEGGEFSGLYPEPGMSLRDYLAAQALSALIIACQRDTNTNGNYPAHCAGNAYRMADAMLAARDAQDGAQ